MIFGFHPIEGGYDVPMRMVGANIPYEWLIYIFMFIPIGIFLFGFYKRFQVWTLAKGELHRNDRVGERLISLLKYSFAQAKVIKKPLAGWMHFLFFWGLSICPSKSIMSRWGLITRPGSITKTPLTFILPSTINCSALRRDAAPAAARYFASLIYPSLPAFTFSRERIK
jgi:hypothetical protein